MPTQMAMPPLDLRAAVSTVDSEKRTATLTWSTGADVIRYDWETGRRYIERLSLDSRHVRMGRLASGSAPLLDSHSAYSVAHQIGVVERASLANSEGTADVRFSDRAEVDEGVWRDVKNGIVKNTSVGYRVYRFEELADRVDDLPVRLATDWEPYEVSMVPMGADAGARVRSSKDVETNPCVIVVRAGLAITDQDRARLYRLAQARG